jgi:glutamine synthetase
MQLCEEIAARYNLACLFQEKPFADINGSGKHNNWALATDTGVNLLDPGDAPAQDIRFLLVLGSTLLAVLRHAAVLRASIAGAGNDHRLGANEAPPPILSAYLGAALDGAVRAVVHGEADAPSGAKAAVRVAHGVHLRRDPGDRNRTSPFAFTGNKFEFRAVGSSEHCAWPQAVLNAAVADAMDEVCGRIESAMAAGADQNSALWEVARAVLRETRVVCFEGDGYSNAWRKEAAQRGLPILPDTAAALGVLHDPSATAFLIRQGVLGEQELTSRAEVLAERYVKQLDIEARAMLELTRTAVVPAVELQLARTADAVRAIGAGNLGSTAAEGRLRQLGDRLDGLLRSIDGLAAEVDELSHLDGHAAVQAAATGLRGAMAVLRAHVDAAEAEVADDLWPLAHARELLFIGV